MRIRKVAQSIGVAGKVVNSSNPGNTIDTYSCDYMDNHFMPTLGAIGTWTPSLENINGNNPTVEYVGRRGWYQIIGNVAFVSCYVRFKITALNVNGDYAIIRGLPSSIMNNIIQTNVGNIGFSMGVLYNAIEQTSNNIFVLDGGSGNGVRPQTSYGSSATTWKVTDTPYAEVGFSGIILLDN